LTSGVPAYAALGKRAVAGETRYPGGAETA